MMNWNWKIASLGVAASVGLATMGLSGPLKSAVTSLGDKQYLQVNIGTDATGSGPGVAQFTRGINAITFDVAEQSASGVALSQAAGHVKEQITVKVGETNLLTLISVGKNLFVDFDLAAVSKVPGITVSPAQLASAQLLLGNRWFEFPESLLTQELHAVPGAGTAIKLNTNADKVLKAQIMTELTKLFSQTQIPAPTNGVYSVTGTLNSLWKTFLPILRRVGDTTLPTTSPSGTFTATLSTSGTEATGASLALALPDGTAGHVAIKIHATFEHAAFAVNAPAQATVVTPAMISALSGLTSGSLASLG
ncbi:MAG TPA: hypothetical protein VIJ86_10160 [Acidimicrobiales bacterium]